MAVSLGRAGDRVMRALAAYQAVRDDSQARLPALKAAAQAVHAYFIQRELWRLRRQRRRHPPLWHSAGSDRQAGCKLIATLPSMGRVGPKIRAGVNGASPRRPTNLP